jgi:hypothetical protein
MTTDELISVLRDPAADLTARSRAMMGLQVIGPAAAASARASLIELLANPSPTVRRGAIVTLEKLDDLPSQDAIARLLTDDTLDPSAWFDDDCTVSQTAHLALDALEKSAYGSDRHSVHVFVSTGRFRSFEEMRAYIDMTYTEDGDGVPSAFMREVGLQRYEPMCVEANPSESGRPLPVAELIAGCSWADRWLPALDGTKTADAAICVFTPNLVPYPERCSLEHLGVVHFQSSPPP